MAALTRLGVTGNAKAYPPFTAKRNASIALFQEINFRSTTAYRSDDSVNAHVEATLSVTYPTVTAQGNTVGWEQVGYDPFKFDSSLSVDVRLAGSRGSVDTGAPGIYRVDLPAPGTYRIRCAAGRFDAIRGANIRIFDDSSLLSEIIPPQALSAAGRYIDASNVELSAADWPSLNQSVDLTFTSSTLRVYNGGQDILGVAWAFIAHFSVESVSPPFDNAVSGAVSVSGTTGTMLSSGAYDAIKGVIDIQAKPVTSILQASTATKDIVHVVGKLATLVDGVAEILNATTAQVTLTGATSEAVTVIMQALPDNVIIRGNNAEFVQYAILDAISGSVNIAGLPAELREGAEPTDAIAAALMVLGVNASINDTMIIIPHRSRVLIIKGRDYIDTMR